MAQSVNAMSEVVTAVIVLPCQLAAKEEDETVLRANLEVRGACRGGQIGGGHNCMRGRLTGYIHEVHP